MKKKIIFVLFFCCAFVFLYSNDVLKIPKSNFVSIQTINTLEETDEYLKELDVQSLPKLANNKILINQINFYNKNDSLIYSCELMNIFYIQKNDKSNIFLCSQLEQPLVDSSINKLYLFDFVKGKRFLIDKNVYTYLLSSDGNKVYYVSDFDYTEDKIIYFKIWKNNKIDSVEINCKQYASECNAIRLKNEKDNIVIYLHDDASVLGKLVIDSKGNILWYLASEYDEDLEKSFIRNPEGTIEYFD